MIEIEHKFILKNDGWKATASEGIRYQQGYISTTNGTAVRVRIAGDKSYLTLKGPRGGEEGISCTEFEYEIPLNDARAMIAALVDSPLIDKLRYLVIHQGKTWEIDIFSGDNAGLEVAEIELSSEHEKFEIPSWAGSCVSQDHRYCNYSLAQVPFKDW
ncbi:MAG: CYTH domain-containing protein [Rubritalea sp.]|jgi:adenylate cyclase|tara:strand:+ start:7880 stop:8353 length:474 start_codon:yes stop_codon:yes gene_type:complete